MLANVIFPAPSAAYVANIFIPVSAGLALVTEFGVFYWFQRGRIRWFWLALLVVGINVFSWLVGFLISWFLPSGLVKTDVLTTGPYWGVIALFSFVYACFMSAALEYTALRPFQRRLALRDLGFCVLCANIASYIVIGLTVWIYFLAGWI